jgi:2-oxo-3-hexenedioate decarboxylase
MNVEEPVYGWITDAMVLPPETPFVKSTLIHPRAEPEVVFYLGDDLPGPKATAQDALDATLAVSGGIEIIDSRYENFRFTLPDVVADNTSAARFTLGTNRIAPEERDLALLGCVFEKDGAIEATATCAATMGHPAEAVAMLANHLGRRGKMLEAGWVILAGGLTSAVFLHPGTHVAASYAGLGAVRVRVARETET